MSHLRLAVLLGMTVALGPFALDTYLPAFPRIAAALGAGHAQIGLTLSIYVIVLGLGQLIGGPLSDRYGRRNVLFAGIALFGFASVMVSLAESVEALLAWRGVQGLGGAWCAVSVPAIVRDRVRGTDAARLFALIGLVMFVAPALAPSIGSLVLTFAGWRAIFVFLAAYAALVAVLLYMGLFRHAPEPERSRTPVITLVTNYARVLRHAAAMRFIALQALVFSTMMVFITHASFIYQEWFGLSKTVFSALFAANVAGMAATNLLNRRLLLSFSAPVLLRAAITVQAAAVITLAAVSWLDPPAALVAGLIIVSVSCMGMIAPNNIASTLEYFPTLGGTASAALGATQYAFAGAVSALSTALADGTLVPIALTMAACGGTALILALPAPGIARRGVLVEAET
ncbi:MAG: multidrug effflux MFS transporter [Halofilum sp. (in: g-proteobacteria)]